MSQCEFLTSEEVAKILGYSVRTVTNWLREYHESGGTQGLACFRVGVRGSWRVEHKDLDAYIVKIRTAAKLKLEKEQLERL